MDCKKKKFASRDNAKGYERQHRWRNGRQTAYLCQRCGHFHLTKKSSADRSEIRDHIKRSNDGKDA